MAWRSFCSTFTIMTSPTTRTLWVCESSVGSLIVDTTRGRAGSRTSMMLVP